MRSLPPDADVLAALLAVVAEIVACNRTRVDNGRAYLREVVFGDPTEPHHGAALALTAETERTLAALLVEGWVRRGGGRRTGAARHRGDVPGHDLAAQRRGGDDQVLAQVRAQVAAVLGR